MFFSLLGGVHLRTKCSLYFCERQEKMDRLVVGPWFWRFGMWMTYTETIVQGKNKEQQHSTQETVVRFFPQTIDLFLKTSKPPSEQRLSSV